MAKLEKLLFRGIRSFGPENDDEAKLKFASPLTIILGQNGCGKTTIIEALKYATCGDMPSNTNLGAGFVHDPKLSNTSEVRAQVKLQIRDIKGNPVYVSRCMQTTQMRKKLQFKTLDQTITRKDQTGQDVSISLRCADIDAEMCVALGVSKAILNNVIFCHQEDSNWPLEEGKKLKEKFDLIFDVVKYNKCLLNIREQKKILDADLKDKKKDLENLEVRKEEALEKKNKLQEEEGRLNVIHDKVNEYESELGPIKRRMVELVNREIDISRLLTQRERSATTLSMIQANIREYKDKLPSEFQGSTDELEQAIQDFLLQSGQHDSKLKGLETEMQKSNNEEQRLGRLMNAEQIILGQLTRDEEHHLETINLRNNLLTILSEQLTLTSNVLTEGNVVRSIGSVERAIKEAESEVEALRDAGLKEEKTLQAKIDALREEKTKLEQLTQLKRQQVATNQQETRKVKSQIDEVNQSTEKLDRLQKQLERVQSSMEELSKTFDLSELEKKVKDSESRRDMLEDNLTTLDTEVRELQAISQILTELNIQRDAKNAKEADIRKLKNKTEDRLLHVLGSIPETGINHQLQSCIQRLAQEIRSTQTKITEKQKQVTMLESDRKHLKDKLKEKTKALAKDKEELDDACDGQPFEELLANTTAQLDKEQDEKGTLKASEHMFQKYVDKLRKPNSCCPLCHRGFSEAQESEDLINDLEGRMHGLPRMIQNMDKRIEQLQDKQSRLQQLRPAYERISQLQDQEIPALENQLKETELKLGELRQELTTLQTDLEVPQADKSTAESIQGDAALLDQHLSELRKLEREINKLNEKMPRGGSSKTLEEASGEQDKLRRELQGLRKSLQTLQDKRNRHTQVLHQLQSEKNSIVEQQLKIQGGVQQKKQLEDKLNELQVQEIVLMEELDGINEDVQPVNDKFEAANVEKEQARLTHKKQLERETTKVNKLVRQFEELQKFQDGIAKYEKSGKADKLSSTKQNISRLGKEKESVVDHKTNLQEQIDEVKAYITNQQVRQRELDDNLKLRKKREEEKTASEEVSELSAKIGGLDLKKVMREKEDLKKREEAIMKDKAHTEGRKRELQDNIQYLRTELNKDEFKNADKKYSDALIESEVISAASQDLNEYAKALDWSISHFHNERMKHINDIIGDLWTQIYCGNDIDTIKIKNDEDPNQGDSKRKTYNYRVVQVKNGQELDMRGRCSAGQKMLACLIIRMALAEIFSTKCGILTLDEPTTNLDRDNIDRLCAALATLIDLRSTQRSNFQLVLITHDEEFIDKLSKMHKVDYYFLVTRNTKGKSVVSTKRVE